jgi:membrane protein
MALFPFMLFILNLMPYIPISGYQEDFLQFVSENVPPNTYSAIEGIITDITKKSNGNLISFGFLLTIYLMSNGVNSLLSGFELSENISIKRPFFRQYVVAICLSLILAFVLLITVALLIYIEVAIVKIESQVEVTKSIALLQIAKYIFLLVMVYISMTSLYKLGTKETKSISFWNAGAILTIILFVVTSYIFGIYVEKFAKYNELYGSIGTLLVIMFYIWINCILLLIGFELNAFIFRLKSKN